jgi:isopentenyl diphosphate isomerase/L-lactate dehydrogenase-like FMN-dependent dehydrogenase
VKETKDVLSLLIEELKTSMFLVGADSVQTLQETPIVVMGETAKWLRMRKFNVDGYARRGRS